MVLPESLRGEEVRVDVGHIFDWMFSGTKRKRVSCLSGEQENGGDRMRVINYLKIVGMGIVFVALFSGIAIGASLVWDPVQGAQGYRVYWGTSPGNYPNSRDAESATQYNLNNLPLADKTSYYLTVTAYNSAGESGYASPLSYSTGDNTPPSPPQGISVQ
jgi:hypothetical protein